MPSLDRVIDELEARDARSAAELARVEAEQAEVDELRRRADAVGELLAWLPQAASENRYALHRARARLQEAEAALPEADDEARPAAEARVAAAEAEIARLREHQEAFAQQDADARAEVERLGLAAGASGLAETRAVLSQRRGALLVERSNLAREREAVVREASELLGSVLGDPLAATSVAGLRERLFGTSP